MKPSSTSGAWQCAVGALGSISASHWWLIAGVTTVIVGLIVWVDATRRRPTPAAKLESARKDALARVGEAKAAFDTAVQRSNAAVSSYPSDMVARALDAYDTISGTVGAIVGGPAADAMTTYRIPFWTKIRDAAVALSVKPFSVDILLDHAMHTYDDLTKTVGGGGAVKPILDNARSAFEAGIREALTRPAPCSQSAVSQVQGMFTSIVSDLAQADAESIERLADQAEGLGLLRAFVLPPYAVVREGKTRLAEMREWAVPQSIIDGLANDVLPTLVDPDLNVAREGLYSLLDVYEHWSWYVDRYDQMMGVRATWLVVGVVGTLLAALLMLHLRMAIPALLLAGSSGALVSILSKLPPLLAYGDAQISTRGIARRFGAGFAGSAIGCGLLAAGVLTINFPGHGSFAGILQSCATCERHDASAKSAPAAPAPSPENGGASSPKPSEPGAPDAPGKPAQKNDPDESDGPCSPTNQLILIALGMVLGFSERALTTFEEQVLPTSASSATK